MITVTRQIDVDFDANDFCAFIKEIAEDTPEDLNEDNIIMLQQTIELVETYKSSLVKKPVEEIKPTVPLVTEKEWLESEDLNLMVRCLDEQYGGRQRLIDCCKEKLLKWMCKLFYSYYTFIPSPGFEKYCNMITNLSDSYTAYVRWIYDLGENGSKLNPCHSLREIFGNIFDKELYEFRPSWLSNEIITFARVIHDSGKFNLLPGLAYTLNINNCTYRPLTEHFFNRNPNIDGCGIKRFKQHTEKEAHSEGCWGLDFILKFEENKDVKQQAN